MKFRKKPVVIDAFPLPKAGDFNLDPFFEWATEVGFTNYTSEKDECLVIQTLEGDMLASPEDYIIKGVNGEFYPCKPDIFAKTYEKVD
jgi:hypothetical protein